LEEFEVNPQFLQLVSPNETVVVVSLETTVGESSGMINICIPHVVLESIIPRLSVHYWMQNERTKEREPEEIELLSSHIKKTSMEMSVHLGKAFITVEDLLHLNKEDIIVLDQLIDQPLDMLVEGEQKYKVQPGKRKDKLAVQVLDVLEEGGGTE